MIAVGKATVLARILTDEFSQHGIKINKVRAAWSVRTHQRVVLGPKMQITYLDASD